MDDNSDKDEEDRLSMRQSVMIWIVGAILGWLVAVASVYTALRAPDSDIASDQPASQNDVSPEDAERVQEIMPAAGSDEEKKPSKDDP
tara:strand:+ start:6170 stop:6433 length:264 start_codon:yes stop_codon:yes gene_type:complete